MPRSRPAAFLMTTLALVAALIAVSPAPAAAADLMGAATPAALAKRLAAAAGKHDLGEVARCLAPAARTELTAGMFLSATMMVAFGQMGVEMGVAVAESFGEEMTEEQKAEAAKQQGEARAKAAALDEKFGALLARHGLAAPDMGGEADAEMDQEAFKRQLAAIDQPAFLTDRSAFLDQLAEEGELTRKTSGEAPPDEIADLAIDGDHATGTLGDRRVEMVRLDGRWYFASEDLLGPGGAEPETE